MDQIDWDKIGIGGHTKLEAANKARWAMTGQLYRDAALLESMVQRYTDSAMSQDVMLRMHLTYAAQYLRNKATVIQHSYQDYRKLEQQQQEALKKGEKSNG